MSLYYCRLGVILNKEYCTIPLCIIYFPVKTSMWDFEFHDSVDIILLTCLFWLPLLLCITFKFHTLSLKCNMFCNVGKLLQFMLLILVKGKFVTLFMIGCFQILMFWTFFPYENSPYPEWLWKYICYRETIINIISGNVIINKLVYLQ